MSTSSTSPAGCLSCHIIGITSSSALGAYMVYRAKKATTSSHRFACGVLGLTFFIFASHRFSALFKEVSQQRIATQGRMTRRFEERRV